MISIDSNGQHSYGRRRFIFKTYWTDGGVTWTHYVGTLPEVLAEIEKEISSQESVVKMELDLIRPA